MTNEELKTSIPTLLASAVIEDGNDFLTINVEATDWLAFAQQLRNDASLQFNFLFCLTCVDWKTHLTMVYHLRSTIHRHEIVVKAKLDRTNPEIETVSHIWRTAEFHEREVYEMFGVKFLNHPDLRLLILPDGWEGKKPLLKDFEDPINMIRL
ncbi:NADH-quinone oxidoreductase subunit C [Lacibacter sediminis]|uniref:NADH-quinone oxidoreductase n=1 Tax=Lacibacter sediminis TaxID=2760713 RepID=A0A7G5XE47_9BACT|nr:NADH-quinone oxidoreductase subunit C [Lacibacter sediminis]QNA43750.1 NADH-quinone oxidoreductase subunit C [Lacibacter sediminis]